MEGGRRLPGPLRLVSSGEELMGEQEGVDQGLVLRQVTSAVEEVVANKVHVLVVDDDGRPQFLRHHSTLAKKPHQSRGTVGS